MLNTHKINIKKLFCELDIFKERDDEKFMGGNFRTALELGLAEASNSLQCRVSRGMIFNQRNFTR